MKHRLLSLLVACMMVISGFAAITYSLNESFESGISASWSQENVNNTSAAVIWVLDESSANPTGAKDGDHRVALRAEDNSEPYCVRLITPVLDLSAVNNPQLSFAYAQPKRGGQFSDTLSVYYRTSSTGEWQLVRKFEDYQALWAEVTITLPAAAKVATCQLAFEGTVVMVLYWIRYKSIRNRSVWTLSSRLRHPVRLLTNSTGRRVPGVRSS